MCAVSATIDYFKHKHNQSYFESLPSLPSPLLNPSRLEFDNLKAEVEALKVLIKAAKKFDEITGQPDCEMEDKKKYLLDLAKFLNVDFKDIL